MSEILVYVEVDSNDADYVGSMQTTSSIEIPLLLKWKNGEVLNESERERCRDYVPFVDNYYGEDLVDRLHKLEFYQKLDVSQYLKKE